MAAVVAGPQPLVLGATSRAAVIGHTAAGGDASPSSASSSSAAAAANFRAQLMAAVAELLFMDLANSSSDSGRSKITGGSAPTAVAGTKSNEASSQGLGQGASAAAAEGGFTLILTAEASDHDEVLELLQLLVSWPAAAAMLCGVLGQGQRQRIEEVMREL